MALQPPSPQTNVPRDNVGEVVDAMLLDKRVNWIAIVLETGNVTTDKFTITPYVENPQ